MISLPHIGLDALQKWLEGLSMKQRYCSCSSFYHPRPKISTSWFTAAALAHTIVIVFKPDEEERKGRLPSPLKWWLRRCVHHFHSHSIPSNVLHSIECSAHKTFLQGRLIFIFFNILKLKKKTGKKQISTKKKKKQKNDNSLKKNPKILLLLSCPCLSYVY